MFGTLTPTRHQVSPLLPYALVATVLALSASPVSAQEPKTITVVLTEYQFTPSTITLTTGQPVQINIQNQGKADHNLSSDDLPLASITYVKADNSTQDLSRYTSTNVLNADALSGHTSVVTFIPTTPGTFGFFSEDEQKLGMIGKFVVVAPGAGQTAAPAPSTSAAAPSASSTVARDGQNLASQSAATQAMFAAVWGDRAAQQWATEHNGALPH